MICGLTLIAPNGSSFTLDREARELPPGGRHSSARRWTDGDRRFGWRCPQKFPEWRRFREASFVVPMPKPMRPAETRRETMRVMVFVKATDDSETGMAPTSETIEAFAAMDRFTEELVKAGVFVAAAGLKPSAEGKRIAFDGASRTVIDGPFAEARELVAGFSIWEVKDMDEAVAWAKRCPNPMSGPSEIEIRPFFEVADLADFVTPEEFANPRVGERGKLGVA
jgi:hypothetical protein